MEKVGDKQFTDAIVGIWKKEANYVLSLNIMQFEQTIQATSKVTCNYLVISINVLTNR